MKRLMIALEAPGPIIAMEAPGDPNHAATKVEHSILLAVWSPGDHTATKSEKTIY